MLPQKHRLPKKEIDLILRNGKYFVAKNFILKYKKNNAESSRACLIVSAKVSKKATKRNLIKRRLRYALYLIFKKNPAKLDIVLIAKPTILSKKYSEIFKELSDAFYKITTTADSIIAPPQ